MKEGRASELDHEERQTTRNCSSRAVATSMELSKHGKGGTGLRKKSSQIQ